MQYVKKYFPQLSQTKVHLLSTYKELLSEWNEKINLVSRKDIDAFEENHLLPTLAFTKKFAFSEKASVLDVGTGGGIPGIPLAICFPKTKFLLVDSIGKKIKVVQDIAQKLDLKNVKTKQTRVEALPQKFDYIIGRAVTALPRFVGLVEKKLSKTEITPPSGIFYLKGGNFTEDIEELKNWETEVTEISPLFDNQLCQTKKWIFLRKI